MNGNFLELTTQAMREAFFSYYEGFPNITDKHWFVLQDMPNNKSEQELFWESVDEWVRNTN